MYLTQLTVEDLGPIGRLDVKSRFAADGSPVPIVFVGANGSGKSLVLSLLMDALVESQKRAFTELHEVTHQQFLRLGSKSYIRAGADFSAVHVSLGSSDVEEIAYDEVNTTLSVTVFREKHPELQRAGSNVADRLAESNGFFRNTRVSAAAKDRFKDRVLLYFPYFRYERPAWLNPQSALSLELKDKIAGAVETPVVQVDLVNLTCKWLLDTVLDREIYEKKTGMISVAGGSPQYGLRYSGPNNSTIVLIEKVLLAMLHAKNTAITMARFGVSSKAHRQIAIIVTESGLERTYCPNLPQLSSGELMLLSMVCAIVRAHESVAGAPPHRLGEVKGVVVVDEIDLHLHISLQRSILPLFLRLLPNVQFIVSTHSPFFVLGMTDEKQDAVDVISLPNGERIAPAEFGEFQAGYDAFFEKNEQFKSSFESVSVELAKTQRTLIVTEGKTDWKHLKSALSRLKSEGKHKELDIEFLEYEAGIEMGDSQLATMCKHFSKTPHSRKVVFVFDRDVESVVKDMGGDSNLGYKKWSDHVFSLCIPIPRHRLTYENVSIEFYYTDEEVRTVDPSTGRRLLFTNEVVWEQSPGSKSRVSRTREQPVADEEAKKKIYDHDCDRVVDKTGELVAHSKSVFAENVLGSVAGFDCFDVAAFGGIFDVLERIVLE